MSKGHGHEKSKEIQAPEAHTKDAKPGQTEKGGDHKGGAHGGEHKKADSSTPTSKAKGHTPMPGGCHAWGCKAPEKRFNFCTEHYEHFKFGLIKKTGEPVSDYEKKFEHYQAFLKKKAGAQRVA